LSAETIEGAPAAAPAGAVSKRTYSGARPAILGFFEFRLRGERERWNEVRKKKKEKEKEKEKKDEEEGE
jgi:hypothetical protein